MKYIFRISHIFLILLFSLFYVGCEDNTFNSFKDSGEIGELEKGSPATISLTVNGFAVGTSRVASPSDEKEEATDDENKITDLWIFQYENAVDDALIEGGYYTIEDNADLSNIPVLLKTGVPSRICVVANTHDPDWGKNRACLSYSGLKNFSLPDASPILQSEFRPIPMEGEVQATVSSATNVNIDVTRMFAKVKISFGKIDSEISSKSVEVSSIPDYCRIKSLGDNLDETSPAVYNSTVQWVTSSFNADIPQTELADKEFVLYVPENLQGETTNDNEQNKNVNAPSKALIVNFIMTYNGADYTYPVYPGENKYNNFNIRRNNVYRVKVNIQTPSQEPHTPSSNCYVVIPGRSVSFEPYYRTETGGLDGSDSQDLFKISTYMDPADETGKKVIDHVQILWQTKDAIGDNSKNDLVSFVLNETYPIHSRITVKTNDKGIKGNALIGAFNKDNEILWSWHIWITNTDPGNVGNAVVYTTYNWDNDKIYSWQQGVNDGVSYPRVPGYAIMSCNLGALADEPSGDFDTDTFGMLYQWGRKDPFPPMIKFNSNLHDYNNEATGYHYDYTNKKIIDKTSAVREDEKATDSDPKISFYSNVTAQSYSSSLETILYANQHPSVYICGTETAYEDGRLIDYLSKFQNYIKNGNWLPEDNNKLWGGLDPDDNSDMNRFVTAVDESQTSTLYANYGNEKTIFDPCPKGWRVPPGDLWLGFSKTGLNPEAMSEVNYDAVKTPDPYRYNMYNNIYGMYMYMRRSKWDVFGNLLADPGPSLFFPTQGPRMGDGSCYRVGICGNYHNATTNKTISNGKSQNRVNILHIHHNNEFGSVEDRKKLFRIFETFLYYNVKSVGGPVRCVRDRK